MTSLLKLMTREQELMCELLRRLGYVDGVMVFEQDDRWYS